MIQPICQCLVALSLVVGFISMVNGDFNGLKAKQPAGFDGFVGSLVATIIAVIIFAGAGLFDRILWCL